MCHQEEFKLEVIKGQVLSESELGKIEAKLDECWNASEISRYLGRDDSAIRNEIRNFSYIKKPSINYEKKCEECRNFRTCSNKKVCDGGCVRRECKGCNIAPLACSEYEPEATCKFLKGKRRVCNGCGRRNKCKKPKKLYSAKISIQKHAQNKLNSIKKEKGINSPELLDKLSEMIKKGISPEVALNKLPKEYEITLSVPTVYSYIEKGLMNCLNIDLRNKVKRKVKSVKTIPADKRKHRNNGRSYDDLPDIAKGNDEFGYVEMDTVEGVKGGKLLLTLVEKSTSFLFGIPISNKTQKCIVDELNELEQTFRNDFNTLFSTILTDNGVEFLDFTGIEQGVDGNKRTDLYYANPYASYQKGLIENQHRLIRYFFPKGLDFSKYTDKIIIEQINKVNNYPRKRLGWKTPYQMLCEHIDSKLLEQLGFYYIPIEKLNMKSRKAS